MLETLYSTSQTFEIGSLWLPISRTGNKFPQALWGASISGGPFTLQPEWESAHSVWKMPIVRGVQISPEEFDAVAAELEKSLVKFGVPRPREAPSVGSKCCSQRRGSDGVRSGPWHSGRSSKVLTFSISQKWKCSLSLHILN
jgi:hypothetical protein